MDKDDYSFAIHNDKFPVEGVGSVSAVDETEFLFDCLRVEVETILDHQVESNYSKSTMRVRQPKRQLTCEKVHSILLQGLGRVSLFHLCPHSYKRGEQHF